MAGEEPTLQVLDLLRRELRAANVYLEFGGTARLEPTVLSHALDEHWRVVAVFNEAPPSDSRERLQALLTAFSNTRPSLGPPGRVLGRPPAERRLDEELIRLQELIGAQVAMIIDDSSPIIWGSSALRGHGADVDFLLTLADLASRSPGDLKELAARLGEPLTARAQEPTQFELELERLRANAPPQEQADWYRGLLAAVAVAPFRSRRHPDFRGRRVAQPPPVGYVAQALASQYLLLFIFAEPFSQLHAEATAVHATPYLERLIQELPPIDPEGGARAQRMPKLKLV